MDRPPPFSQLTHLATRPCPQLRVGREAEGKLLLAVKEVLDFEARDFEEGADEACA